MSSSTRACSMQNSGCVILCPSDRPSMDENSIARSSHKRKASVTPLEPPLRPNVIGHRAPYPHNLPHGLVNGCNICPKTSRRIECSGCRAVDYCCADHQALDQAAHQTICDRIRRLDDLVGETESEIDPLCPWDRDPGYDEAPNNPFGPSNPNFWYWKGTRKYMYLRRDYAYEMVKLNTKTAVEHALDDTWALLRMDPEDHLGMHCIMPSLLLRLKRDRECYDFCKWWVTEGNDDNDWDWQSLDMPLTFEDAFESADMFERIRDYGSDPPMFSDLSFLLAILLLKIRMRQDLESLRYGGNDSFPQWSLSSIVLDFRNDPEREDDREEEDYREGKEYLPLLKEVENQIRRLYRAVGRANKHFWPAFMNPWTHLEAKPSSYGLGDEAEMQIKLQECFNAWMDTPEATGPIRDLMEGDDRYWYSMSGF